MFCKAYAASEPHVRKRLHAGVLLYDVRNCSDMRKDAAGIAELLSGTGAAIMGGEERADIFGGWVVDNTRTHMSALRLLEEERPTWVNTGCIAHGTALAIKDFCKVTKTGGRYSVTWGCPWLSETNDAANTIANYIQDGQRQGAAAPPPEGDLWRSSRCRGQRTHTLCIQLLRAEERQPLNRCAQASSV
jgi:hypothetical protein